PLGAHRVGRPRQPHELRRVRVPHPLRLLARGGRASHAARAPRGPRGGRLRPARGDGAPRAGHARLRPAGHDREGRAVRIERVGSEVHLDFTAEEAGLMTVLAHQFADVVRDPELDDAPLLALLFPDAYRDDPEAASEFHRYTRGEPEPRKIAAAE